MFMLINFLLFTVFRFSSCDFLGPSNRWTHFVIPPGSSSFSQSITSDSCKGILPWTCVCQPEVSDSQSGPGTGPVRSISCINSRLTDTDVLLSLQSFPNVESATFYGNNFLEFRDRILGPGAHKSLLYLNLSSNNLLYLHQDTFVSLPSLQSLDLSDNAIYLKEETGDWLFVRPLKFLRRLLLRGAFRKPLVNASAQLVLLARGIRHARLRDLQFLDLSDNEFDQFPPWLVCYTPSLTHLILESNRLLTLHFDKHCPVELKALDLRWNRLKYFDHRFISSARFFGPTSVQVAENPLDCSSSNCRSFSSIKWFQSTAVIKGKGTVRCESGKGSLSYMSYVKLKQGMNCEEQEDPVIPATSTATFRTETSTSPYIDDGNNDELEALTLLISNETTANNSAIAFPLPLLIPISPINISSIIGTICCVLFVLFVCG